MLLNFFHCLKWMYLFAELRLWWRVVWRVLRKVTVCSRKRRTPCRCVSDSFWAKLLRWVLRVMKTKKSAMEQEVILFKNPVHSVADYTNSGSSQFPAFFNTNYDYKIRSQIFFSNLKAISLKHHFCVTIHALYGTMLVLKSNQFYAITFLDKLSTRLTNSRLLHFAIYVHLS